MPSRLDIIKHFRMPTAEEEMMNALLGRCLEALALWEESYPDEDTPSELRKDLREFLGYDRETGE